MNVTKKDMKRKKRKELLVFIAGLIAAKVVEVLGMHLESAQRAIPTANSSSPFGSSATNVYEYVLPAFPLFGPFTTDGH